MTARNSRLSLEVLGQAFPEARLSRLSLEVLTSEEEIGGPIYMVKENGAWVPTGEARFAKIDGSFVELRGA